jgi:hypothetical protein
MQGEAELRYERVNNLEEEEMRRSTAVSCIHS